MFRALFDLESDPDPHPNKNQRNRVFVSETWNDNQITAPQTNPRWRIYKGIFVWNLDTGHVVKHAF